MAMAGGLMKVHNHGNRGKPYGLMILLAFCAAIIGVLALHKVREGRVLSLLLQEKDQELATLHLLLQREKEHVRQVKWKVEELKTKVNTLKSQKRNLDNKIVDMQSTISSLREEQRTIELTLEEKQNEIKLMRERYTEGSSNSNPQVSDLSQTLSQKESQVDDSKSRLEKVWSVSTDDPSSAGTNSQTETSVTARDDTKAIAETQSGTGLQEPDNLEAQKNATGLADGGSEPAEIRNQQYATQVEDTKKDGGQRVERRGKITEPTEMGDDSEEIVSEHGSGELDERNAEEEHKKNDESQTGEASGIREENNSAQIRAVGNQANEGDEIHEGYSMENEMLQIQNIEDGLQVRTSISQGAQNQESGMKGGQKLEMSNHPQNSKSGLDEGYLRKTKRKKSKIHKTRKNKKNLAANVAAATSETNFIEGITESEVDKSGYQGTTLRGQNHYKSLSFENNSGSEDHESKMVDKKQEEGFPDQEAREQGGMEHGEKQKDLETNKSTELEHISMKEIPTDMNLQVEDEVISNTKQQSELEPENQATSIQQPEERDTQYQDEVAEQTDPNDNGDQPLNTKMEDAIQTESETDATRESLLHSEADGKTYNERPEKPEF